MRLFEHPDFEQAVIRAAEHFRPRGLREAIIEKDYYVTEALRIIEQAAGDKVIFKGGTSLSKGWNLIQRFSEDIDIFLDPTRLHAAPGQEGDRPRAEEACARPSSNTRPCDSLTRRARPSAASAATTASSTASGSPAPARSATASSSRPARRAAGSRPSASGSSPTSGSSSRKPACRSAPTTRGRSRCGCCTSAAPSSRRCSPSTARSRRSSTTGKAIGGYARHYYDLYCLAERPEVVAMLGSDEYGAIKADYDRISREHFERSYVPPPGHELRDERRPVPAGRTAAGSRRPSSRGSAGCCASGRSRPGTRWRRGLRPSGACFDRGGSWPLQRGEVRMDTEPGRGCRDFR